jgi:hypothetical protein
MTILQSTSRVNSLAKMMAAVPFDETAAGNRRLTSGRLNR